LKDLKKELEQRDRKIAELEGQIAGLVEKVAELTKENDRLRELLEGKAKAKSSQKPKFSDNYSGRSDGNSSKKKGRGKGATGRRPSNEKQQFVSDTVEVYPEGVDQADCVWVRTQCAWRIVDGRAVYVRYEIFDRPDSAQAPLPPGLRNSRSEFGLEVILIVAFLHYWIGVSLSHACQIIEFFTGLKLTKSQAHSLLDQLGEDWRDQEQTIAQLVALQWIVYIDETGWKVGGKSCYTWVFSSALYILFRCGVSRSKEEALDVLGAAFAGIGVTDDFGAYKYLFDEHQLCWAHLIRKAVKLALQHPDEPAYAQFLDDLAQIYRQAVRYRKDRRLSVGREQKARALKAAILALCDRHGEPIDSEKTPEHEATFIRLQNELADNVEKLFVFVVHPQVEPTNNISERNVRREAEIRKGGRTSKTANGAKRRGIIMSVLMSLRQRFTDFTLRDLLEEVCKWKQAGQSLFEKELERLKQANAPPVSP
jgi:transposase